MRRTKIVATLGPATDDPVVLDGVISAGVDVVRLNAAHAGPGELATRLRAARDAAQRVGRDIGVLLDLPGPKIRVGDVEPGTVLQAGAPFRLLAEECVGDSAHACISHRELASDVSSGDTILIEAWGGGTELKGLLRTVEPSGFTKVSALGVEEQRVNIVGDFLTPPQRLGDRFRIEVRIVTWQAADVLKVPVSALVREGTGWAVFAIHEGRAHLLPVQVGHRGSSEIELLGGLAVGDTVIVHPSDQIAEGVRVGP